MRLSSGSHCADSQLRDRSVFCTPSFVCSGYSVPCMLSFSEYSVLLCVEFFGMYFFLYIIFGLPAGVAIRWESTRKESLEVSPR